MSPEELAIFVSTIAIAISKDKTTQEITMLGTVLTQLSDTLFTIAAQRQFLESKENKDE